MAEPTSINKHRRYTKREKAVAVTAALASSTLAASERAGIPESTLRYWVESPEFAKLREKTREDLAEGSMVLANLAQSELVRKVKAGEVEPRDLAVIYGIAIDKGQLLAGHATSRNENRDLTHDDHEAAILRDVVQEELARRGERGDAAPGADAPAVESGAPAEAGAT